MIYNSALKNANVNVWEKYKKTFTQGQDCIAFSHDLTTDKKLPDHYNTCDVFYSEIPWQHGYTQFFDRAEMKADSSYNDFVDTVVEIVKQNNKPFLITGGKGLARKLPEGYFVKEIKMVHCKAWVYSYNYIIPENIKDTFTLLDYLADNFQRLGNFTCGYGHSGFKFLERGKTFVMSDINQYCIGYIDEKING